MDRSAGKEHLLIGPSDELDVSRRGNEEGVLSGRVHLFIQHWCLTFAASHCRPSLFAGVLILLGPDVEPVVNVAPDWETYSYAKLDVKDNAHDKGSPCLGSTAISGMMEKTTLRLLILFNKLQVLALSNLVP